MIHRGRASITCLVFNGHHKEQNHCAFQGTYTQLLSEKGKSLQFPRFELCGGNSGAYAFYISRVPRKASELSWRMQGGIEAKVAAKFSIP